MQLRLQIRHVVVFITKAHGLAQANAVNDGGVVQFITDDSILFRQEGLKQPAVGIKAGGVEDRVIRSEKGREALLQPLVDILRAADKAHGRDTVALIVIGALRRLNETRIVAQAKIVVCAHAQQPAPVLKRYIRALW